jgi:hypothetical protein
MAELNSQREKLDEAYRKDREKWLARRTDLNDQLEAMHAKLRVSDSRIQLSSHTCLLYVYNYILP